MPILEMTAEEIKILRKTLKMSEAELASRIQLEDSVAVKLLESGAVLPTIKMHLFSIRRPNGAYLFAPIEKNARNGQGTLGSPPVSGMCRFSPESVPTAIARSCRR